MDLLKATISRTSTGIWALAVSLALVSLPVTLHAQHYDNPGLGSLPVSSHPQDYKPLGIRAGAFMLHPGVNLAAEWTDNAFYAEEDLKNDTIFHVRPYFTAQSTWSRHSFNVRLAADFARYKKYSARDYEDYFFDIGGRVDVRNRSAFNYSLNYMNLHEGLNNRTSEQGVQPTRYDVYGAQIGYDHTFNRVSLGGWYSLGRFDYDNVLGEDGEIIDNQDRDRDIQSYGVRVGYQFVIDKQFFVSYAHYRTKYDETYDRNGYDRSGDGYTINAGINFTMTDRLNGDVYASYYSRDFDDPNLPGTSGWLLGGGASLQWNITDLTTLSARLASGVQETTDANSTSFVSQSLALRLDHELTRDIQLNAFVAYSIYDYQPIDDTLENRRTKDDTLRAGLGGSWFINRHMYLNASYDWEQLSSSVANDDYTANRIWLSLGLEY